MAVFANVISLIGCAMMVAIGLIRNKDKILTVQCVQFVFQGAAHLMLGAVSGFVCCVVSIVRNLVFRAGKGGFLLKLGFIGLQTALTFAFTIFAWIELLPILATIVFTWFLDVKNPVHFKLVLISAQMMWLVYDLYYGNFVAAAFDVMTVGSTLAGIFLILRTEK